MKKLKVLVEKGDDGTYWGTTQNVPGVISTFGNSLEELKANTQAAFADYVETAEQCKEDWVKAVVSENRLKIIQNTLHELGHELLSVKF